MMIRRAQRGGDLHEDGGRGNPADSTAPRQGRSQDLRMEDKPSGGPGDRSPPAGSRGRAPVGSKGEAPRSYRQNLKTKVKNRLGLKIQSQTLMNHVYSTTGGHAPMSPTLTTPLLRGNPAEMEKCAWWMELEFSGDGRGGNVICWTSTDACSFYDRAGLYRVVLVTTT